VKVIEQPRQALAKAMKVADKEDLICVTGSLYLVGDIKRDFAGNNT
jgi:folylpolyglutamate synthase/dihydropteroate synthase